MLGKRSRPPIRRTMNMTGITVDVEESQQPPAVVGGEAATVLPPNDGYDHRSMAMLSPRYHIETPNFLRTCSFCNRRLAPSRDIFMYRGDTAFCSQECREQKMKLDERKEKCNNNGENHMIHQMYQPLAAPPVRTKRWLPLDQPPCTEV